MAGFDPSKSMVKEDALAAFLAAPISEDLEQVPGIGPAAKKALAVPLKGDQAVTTTYQLVGKFLTLRAAGMTQQEHLDAMWHWLNARGISSHRAGIVHSIAEKCNLMIPGIYDSAAH
ncbi:Hypothetical Protein FCC1311_023042 [Hondaea fermentalgiana]|uniref:Uncharacterized protein n=1 Tax=Hondaea fermentalgiana TaxID=2315210 RepID=A0A2R5GE58_9STRA|nr:Hypothetical Protein FCC1311_023042 [Hondaea fermentalgiana]|eukprot:GBG26084.1 Hypothetical Protein FCC1311_023042 [Hondaea fermentalgiana]